MAAARRVPRVPEAEDRRLERRAGARALQAVWSALGVVALAFGLLSVFTGADTLPGIETVSPTVDSELRYYAAWYAAAGVAVLWSARAIESRGLVIRLVCAALFVGACGRLISLLTVGTPHVLSLVLMGLEFAIPVIVLPWHAALTRGAQS